jgi:hypothetical protein
MKQDEFTNEQVKQQIAPLFHLTQEGILGAVLIVLGTDNKVRILANGNLYQTSDLVKNAQERLKQLQEADKDNSALDTIISPGDA